jgi:hypothetical protein
MLKPRQSFRTTLYIYTLILNTCIKVPPLQLSSTRSQHSTRKCYGFGGRRLLNKFRGNVRTSQKIQSIHSLVCLTRAPEHPRQRDLHSVRSITSSSNFQSPLLLLRSFCICLRFLPRRPVTSILPFVFSQ